jgi:hypothetical protein
MGSAMGLFCGAGWGEGVAAIRSKAEAIQPAISATKPAVMCHQGDVTPDKLLARSLKTTREQTAKGRADGYAMLCRLRDNQQSD